MKRPSGMFSDPYLLRLFCVTVGIFALMGAISPSRFLTASNFDSIALQSPEIGLLSIGVMIGLIAGGTNLSVVGIGNLSAIFATMFLLRFAPEGTTGPYAVLMTGIAVLLAVICGGACGALNGFLISVLGIPALLATLGANQFFMGIGLVFTKGTPLFGLPAAYVALGNGHIGFVPIALLVFFAVAGIVGIILKWTPFGFRLYMMGSNPVASRFAGIDNTKIMIQAHMLSGMVAAMGGVLISSHNSSANADYGMAYMLQAVLVPMLGGVRPGGGFGKLSGVIMAILSLQLLSSGFTMLRFSNFSKEFTWGLLLTVVMAYNYCADRKAQKKMILRHKKEAGNE